MNIFDDISPKDIRYFIAVLKEGNLARAGESLGVTQTTMTYSVRRLCSLVP
jgi:DNA-binding transcriptional LysR family regulator